MPSEGEPTKRVTRPPSREPDAASVLVFDERGYILALEYNAGYQIPGGRRETSDATIFDTARRELREETGVHMMAGAEVLRDVAGPHLCACFYARVTFQGPPRDGGVGPEGHTLAWVEPERLLSTFARFPDFYARVFARLVQLERDPAWWREGKQVARVDGACPVCSTPTDDAGDALCSCGVV